MPPQRAHSMSVVLLIGQIVPLLVILIGHPDAVLPLLQATAFAVRSQRQGAEKIVTLAQILVPHRKQHGLLVQLIGTRLEHKLLVEDRIQCAPLDVGFRFLVAMGVRLDLPAQRGNGAQECKEMFCKELFK